MCFFRFLCQIKVLWAAFRNGIGPRLDLLVFLLSGVWFEAKVLAGVKVVPGTAAVDGVRINGRGSTGRTDSFLLFISRALWTSGRNFGTFSLSSAPRAVFRLVGVSSPRDRHPPGGRLALVCVALFLSDSVISLISWGNLLSAVRGIFDFLSCLSFMPTPAVVWDLLIEILARLGGGRVGRAGGVKHSDTVGNDLDTSWDHSLGLLCFSGSMSILVPEIANTSFVDEYAVFPANVLCLSSKPPGRRSPYIRLVIIGFRFSGKFVFLNHFICSLRSVSVARRWIDPEVSVACLSSRHFLLKTNNSELRCLKHCWRSPNSLKDTKHYGFVTSIFVRICQIPRQKYTTRYVLRVYEIDNRSYSG